MIPIIFAVGILIGAFGGILLKMGASHLGIIQIATTEQLFSFLYKVFTDFTLMSGLFLYFLSAIIWSYLLTKLDISLVQPILALTYVVTPILAIFILHEQIPVSRWIGIFIIILGVFVVARSSL